MNRANYLQIIKSAKPILRKAGILRSSLFGSIARGEHKKQSDVDILVKMPGNKDLFDFVRLKSDLEKRLGRKVDLVTFRGLSPFIKKQVLKEQVKII